MNIWVRRLRGAIGMGFTWAILWAILGVAMAAANSLLPGLFGGFFRVFDAPAPALGLPGFFAGALFSLVLAIAARNRKFQELSLGKFAFWGAIGGVMVTSIPLVLSAIGLADINDPPGPLNLFLAAAPPLMILSSLSATISLWLAQRAERSTVGDDRATTLGAGGFDATSPSAEPDAVPTRSRSQSQPR
jgi:hypothetical protein